MKNHLEQNQEELYERSISPHALYVRGLIIGINFQKQAKINAGKSNDFSMLSWHHFQVQKWFE